VREDHENAIQAVNTGIPMAVQGQGKMSKDIAPARAACLGGQAGSFSRSPAVVLRTGSERIYLIALCSVTGA